MKCRTQTNINRGAYNNSGLTEEQIRIQKANAKIKREIYRLQSLAQKSPIMTKELKFKMDELERKLLS
jgi:hypothetical protein